MLSDIGAWLTSLVLLSHTLFFGWEWAKKDSFYHNRGFDEILVDNTVYPCTTSGINRAIIAAANRKGFVYVAPICSGVSITSNLWSGVTSPSTVIFGPGIFTFAAQQILPSNTELACSGWRTKLSISPSLNINIAFASGLFANASAPTLGGTGTNTAIEIHDCLIDGTGNTRVTGAISFYNASNSRLYNNYLNNIWGSGIDIRNGSHNVLLSNWCDNCAAVGAPQHAIGGGIFAQTDTFTYNKFIDNHTIGGGAGADHFDIFGQAANGRCGWNDFIANSSDAAPAQGILLDTCNHNVVTGNVIRYAGSKTLATAIGCTGGVFNLDGGCSDNNFNGNMIYSPSQTGILLSGNAARNRIVGGDIYDAGHEGIYANDSQRNLISGVFIHAPSQAFAKRYCGITINADGGVSIGNTVQDTTVSDPNSSLKSPVCLTVSAGPPAHLSDNVVMNNQFKGATLRTYGDGVADGGSRTLITCNTDD